MIVASISIFSSAMNPIPVSFYEFAAILMTYSKMAPKST